MSIEYPPSVHAGPILANAKGGTHWPMQSEYVWEAFSTELKAEWGRMVEQESAQQIIKSNLEGQTSAGMIPGINRMVAKRDATLADRIAALAVASPAADSVRASIVNLKSDLYWIVMTADQKIKELESKAGIGAAAMLPTEIAAIIAAANLEAEAADDARAAEVTAKTTELLAWSPHGSAKQSGGSATPLSTGIGGEGAYSPPLAPANGSGVQPAGYGTMKEGSPADAAHGEAKQAENPTLSNEAREAAWKPNALDPKEAATANPEKPLPSPAHSSPPVSSAPSSGGSPASSAGSPSSMIGQMMPRSMSSSPAASSSPASAGSGLSSGGGPASSPAAAHAGGPGSPAGAGAPGGGAGAGAAPGSASGVRPAGLAGVGSGISESSARFASGAVNATANALGAAGNLGSQVAQGAASAASAASPAAPAAAPPAAASAPVSGAPVGGAPIGMMPAAAAAGGPGAVAPVTGGAPAVGGGPAATPAASASPVSSVGGATPAASGSALAPVPLNTSPGVRGVGADGATGDALFEQAADVGRDVVSSLMAQTVWAGHITIHYAVALVYEQGAVAAWMATSEGASYIPLGVRIPPDVKLSVTDPVIGRTLWESSAKAGGANPLDVVVRQAQEREMAAPGSRVLAIASSLPMDQVMDWAAEVSARPVAVDPKSITKPAAVDMAMAHRCAVAMPWEWNQANRFDESERRRVAARHGYMAMTAGGLTSGPCEEVVELFDAGQPIPESLWHEVAKARMKPLTEYMLQMQSAGQGGAEPARALAAARAAEVVLCLRHSSTAEGCADLLYATRLAGAPLTQTAAVA